MEKLSTSEIENKLKALSSWEYNDDGIEATLEFENFKDAFAAMTRISFEAEAQNHHPDWTNVYNKLFIRLSTHDAGGVTENDFLLAHTIMSILEGN